MTTNWANWLGESAGEVKTPATLEIIYCQSHQQSGVWFGTPKTVL